MNRSFPIPPYLREYLHTSHLALLAQGGDLPPDLRSTLASKLRAKLHAYARYLPSRLVARQLATPDPGWVGGEFWEGSLLFADLSGFTALSEQLSTLGKQGFEEISIVVNQLFDTLVAVVHAHRGTLLKFGGDALTAFFDAETLGPLHATAATLAAWAMQQHMARFAAIRTRKGVFRLQLRVGVHSGRVFAAEVGDSSHIELVITGAEVNRVAKAQEIAAPGEVVISDHTASLLEHAHTVPRKTGFQRVIALSDHSFSPRPREPLALDGPDDLATLERLAMTVAALRPYLVRNLPERFLDDSRVFEIGEFRPVSVLFAHFYDFSALLSLVGDDASLAAAILNAYFWRSQAMVHRYDGIVNKVDMYTHGDKLIALFGAPSAHEDDPLRAVRCALELETARNEANREIVALLRSSNIPLPASPTGDVAGGPTLLPEQYILRQRIGINTGTVFAGRVGGEYRYEYTVMGSAVNLAARLMAVTPEGEIFLSPATRSAVEHQVALEDQLPLKLKGLSEPVIPARVLQTLGPRTLARKPVSTHSPKQSPLVGREAILEQLKAEAVQALRGTGRTLVLVGEAGIGKTRLTEEIITSLEANRRQWHIKPFQIALNDCQSYEQSTPYATVRALIFQVLGISPQSEFLTRQNWVGESSAGPGFFRLLETRVERLAPELLRFTPLLGDVWGMALPSTPLITALNAGQRHDRLQELLVALVRSSARQRPLVIAFENIQWADASSLELLERLTHMVEHTPLLLILNYRPEPPIAEPWATLPTTTRIVLHELRLEESIKLLEAILEAPPPPEVFPLLERTQGNPLFIEELVRALIASNALAMTEDRRWILTRPLEQLTIPSRIEGLLVARIDRLAEAAHELVQVASVIGRRFQHAILERVYSHPAPLELELQALVDADIISVDEQPATRSFLFRHSLLREVVYEGILFARRRELHQQVAHRIEEVYFGHREEVLPVLAQHYLLAEAWLLAFFYHLEAAIRAQKRYANHEALALLSTAREIYHQVQQQCAEDIPSQHTGQTDKNVALSPYLPLTFTLSEIHERSGYMHSLLGENEQAETHYWQALHHIRMLDVTPYSPAVRAYLQVQKASALVRLHRHLAAIYEQRGDYDTALRLLQEGLEYATTETHDEIGRCHLLAARIFYSQGAFEQSLEWAELGRAIADFLDDLPGQAHALLRIGNIRAEQGDFSQSIPFLEQASQLFQQIGHLHGLRAALNDLGATYEQVGRWQDAIRCYQQSLEISRNVGDIIGQARTSNNLALIMTRRGAFEEARRLYEFSCEQFRSTGSEQLLALSTLNLGELLLLQKQPAQAMTLFRESIEILERTNARLDLPEVLRLAAEASLATGDHEQATTYAKRSLAMAQELGLALEKAMALLALGQIAFSQGDLAASQDYLEQSHTTLEQLDYRYELGKVLFWKARLAQERHDRSTMLTLIEQAKAIFEELDAQRDLVLLTELFGEGNGESSHS